jgi:NAD(P)-dependent dehydrogenase (short-subunit alcohol dehydrogenase family)
MNMFSVQGKNVIVTGSRRGNGLAIAKGFKLAGANVFSLDISSGEDIIPCDVSSEPSITNAFKCVKSKTSKIDVLINCAGITNQGNDDVDKWNKTIAVNLTGPYLMSKRVVDFMSPGASIINITSLNSMFAFPSNPSYVASKGGLSQLTKSLALDLGSRGIRVNAVAPGYFKTDMTKGSFNDPQRNEMIRNKTILGRWGDPEDLIGVCIFLASDASKYITGQEIFVDGGWSAKGM